jgi:DNA-binding transcriptional LysR family regulator
MDKNIGWELYRSFLSVMKEGSLSAAARAIGSTQPTIGRHITELEHLLKITLFIRNRDGLTPTDAAQMLLKPATDMANLAESMSRAVSMQNNELQGRVCITTSDLVATEILPEILATLNQEYEKLKVELLLSDKPLDLLTREADIAIRLFQPKQSQLIARRVGRIEVGLYAHKSYIERKGSPESFAALEQHTFIGFDKLTTFIRDVVKSLPIELKREWFNFRTDSNVAQLALLRAGVGIGVCQTLIAKQNTNLVRVLADDFSIEMDVWITMHEDLRKSPTCNLVFDRLANGLLAYLSELK